MNRYLMAILIQPLLIIFFVCYALFPLWFGEDVYIKTSGYDPRDLFRGNYVDLRYDFNDMHSDSADNASIKNVYAILKEDENGVYKTTHISQNKPKDGLFIRGKRFDFFNKFGVEKYFLPKDKAYELEQDLTNIKDFTAIAHLKVFNGDARLLSVDIVALEHNATR